MGSTVLEAYDALLLDLDGTVYHGPQPVRGAVDGVSAAHRAEVPVRYVTNNAARPPEAVAEQLTGLGIPARPHEVVTSAQAGARLLARTVPAGTDVHVVGTASLAAEVADTGLRVVRTERHNAVAVIQGHSPETTWADLADACLAIRAGAVWVACNIDPTLPTERGQLPGNGSMVAALRTATGVEPMVAGKPEPAVLTDAARSAAADCALIVGDRLDTDVAGGVAAGIDAMVVLSGVTTPADVLAAPPAHRPQLLAADLAAVTEPVSALRIAASSGWQVQRGGDALRVHGAGEPLALLRTLCPHVWDNGSTRIVAGDTDAADALGALGIDADPLP